MSVQILIQGKLLGVDEFLTSDPAASEGTTVARSLWISLVCEVVPRALLAELELARVLLGSSGGGQFLLVLPDAVREASEQFLSRCSERISSATHGTVRLLWAATENLGDWTVVRKRLADEMTRKRSTPLSEARSFAPFVPREKGSGGDAMFTPQLAEELRSTDSIGWSPDAPLLITTGPAKHKWSVSANLSLDGITLARYAAPAEESAGEPEARPADTAELASRSAGTKAWGVLRGDVDLFSLRLRRAQSIEEHVQLSMLYKHFFAGEVHAICLGGEFWRRIAILYTGGNDFAVYGSWDALALFATEMQRTFHRFAEENLAEFPGAEGKTITMAVAIASTGDTLSLALEQAGRNLAIAKASDKDCIYFFDRVIEWNQLADAAELKEAVSRLTEEFREAGRQFLSELTKLYSRASTMHASASADHEKLLRRAYRFQRRYSRAALSRREKEFQKLRTHLIKEIVGRNVRPAAGKQLRLRPAGVVALEWARLSKEA